MATNQESGDDDSAASLEMPLKAGEPYWDGMWQYRAKSVQFPRPIFTGDVFFGIDIADDDDNPAGAIVLQHPCALRSNGYAMREQILVAEVGLHGEMATLKQWQGSYNLMPLNAVQTRRPDDHYAAFFDRLYTVAPDQLVLTKRIACMQILGISLLMQRWIYHNSRVAIPTPRFTMVFKARYAEADGIEDYCKVRRQMRVKVPEAEKEASEWLDALSDDTGRPRRELLDETKNHKTMVKRMAAVAERRNEEDRAEKDRRKAERDGAATASAVTPDHDVPSQSA